MNSGQIGVALLGATALFALWAAIFATRADRATRRATRLAGERWEASTKPVPHITFTEFASPGQSIQVQVENLGGILAGCGMILQKGDELYAGEVTLPRRRRHARSPFRSSSKPGSAPHSRSRCFWSRATWPAGAGTAWTAASRSRIPRSGWRASCAVFACRAWSTFRL